MFVEQLLIRGDSALNSINIHSQFHKVEEKAFKVSVTPEADATPFLQHGAVTSSSAATNVYCTSRGETVRVDFTL